MAPAQLICSMRVAWRKSTRMHTCTRAHAKHDYWKGESVASQCAACDTRNPSQLSRKLNWCDSLHPLQFSLTSPFPPLLQGINEPLPSEQPPRPLLGASSRVWRSYANTCARKRSTSSCCSNGLPRTKQVTSPSLSND